MEKISARKVVLTSFLVDVLDVLLNLIVAIISGSVVVLTQVLEGVSDLLASGLLLVGLKQGNEPADRGHPFGHGRELYFWAMASSIVMFSLTSTLSVYFGWKRFLKPEPVENLSLAYAALSLTAISNFYAFSLSLKRLLRKRSIRLLKIVLLGSSRVETKTTLVLDLMGTVAPILGIVSLVLFKISGDFRFDGIGAMAIGVVLGVLSIFLLSEAKDLLVGRSAQPDIEEKIRTAAASVPGVEGVLDLRTMYIGLEKLLVNIEVHLRSGLTTDDIEKIVDEIKRKIQFEVPTASHIQVEPETP